MPFLHTGHNCQALFLKLSIILVCRTKGVWHEADRMILLKKNSAYGTVTCLLEGLQEGWRHNSAMLLWRLWGSWLTWMPPWTPDKRNSVSSLVKSLSGRTVWDRFWQNLAKDWHIPRKRCYFAWFRLYSFVSKPVSHKWNRAGLELHFFRGKSKIVFIAPLKVRFWSWSISASSLVSPQP